MVATGGLVRHPPPWLAGRLRAPLPEPVHMRVIDVYMCSGKLSFRHPGLPGWLVPGEAWVRRAPLGAGVPSPQAGKVVIWLILPVVICLSQRLSHACLSVSTLYCETANGSLNQLSFI